MNKLWVGSLYYFLNVVLHFGVFGVLFFIAAPDSVTTLEYIVEFWLSAEGRETILINLALLIINLVFALSIIFLAPRSNTTVIIMAVIAWLGLIFAYQSELVGLLAYAAGAIHLSIYSYNQYKDKDKVDV